jgi:hypothetical protein
MEWRRVVYVTQRVFHEYQKIAGLSKPLGVSRVLPGIGFLHPLAERGQSPGKSDGSDEIGSRLASWLLN